jgi:hypothetical protein
MPWMNEAHETHVRFVIMANFQYVDTQGVAFASTPGQSRKGVS